MVRPSGFTYRKYPERNCRYGYWSQKILKLQGIKLKLVTADKPGIWLTATEIGHALQYADDKAVQCIYSRHADEFTEQMTGMVRLTTRYRVQLTRAFSLRGAHLIAVFARTRIAKEFRRWVLDILDRETINSAICNPGDRERHAYYVQALATHYAELYDAWKTHIEPALRLTESPLAGRFHDRFQDGNILMSYIVKEARGFLSSGEKPKII
ncbi:BRO-N domain-containing protein [Pantoea piersonii]|uniref:BRO-N domain-containing protein n=1 Tax=Pantoea piersonii TaxID=2364647 RepID=UPI0022F1DB71|nr:Bro-N domain-containing protein [Pantoea piersonii]WBV23817.1 Bro-N domain-containing protein [Pantoea piersonii]